MLTPQWVYLKNPVPQVVADRAKHFLGTTGLRIGMAWIEPTTAACLVTPAAPTSPAIWSSLLRYTCEDHGHGVTGISVYGLV